MTKERAYQRFLAVLNLARRPGTEEEGKAAYEMAQKMAEKYGFDMSDSAVADPAEQKKAREVVRKWKQYQGDKKKDMMAVYKLAKSVGYVVDGDRILVSPKELNAIQAAFISYRYAKRRSRKAFKEYVGGGESKGFAVLWDQAVGFSCDYNINQCTAGANYVLFGWYRRLFSIKQYLECEKEA